MLDTTTSAIAFVADGADETNHLAGQGVIAVVPTICPLLARDAGLTDHSQHFLHPQKRHTDPPSLVDDLFNSIITAGSV